MLRKILCFLCVVILASASKRRSFDVVTHCNAQRERNEILDFIKSFAESFEERAYRRIEKINADLKSLEDTQKKNIKIEVMEMKIEIAKQALFVDCPIPSEESLTGELDSLTDLVYDMCERNHYDALDDLYDDITNRIEELFRRAKGYIKAARKTEIVDASQLCFRLAKKIKSDVKAIGFLQTEYIEKSTSAFQTCRDIAVAEALKFMPSVTNRAINCHDET